MVKKKKKAKKTVKRKKAVKKKKATKKKKSVKRKKTKAPEKKAKAKAQAKVKEKLIGNIEHFFSKISVAALKLKAPLSVGDMIHVVGPHNDFFQKIDSIQIEHNNVMKAKKGQDIGFKVKNRVRVTDTVFLAAKPALAPSPMPSPRIQPKKSEGGEPRFMSF